MTPMPYAIRRLPGPRCFFQFQLLNLIGHRDHRLLDRRGAVNGRPQRQWSNRMAGARLVVGDGGPGGSGKPTAVRK